MNNKEIIEIIGLSALGGSSLRMYREMTNRDNALSKIRSELTSQGILTASKDAELQHHEHVVSNSLKRLAININHNTTQQHTKEWNNYFRHNTLKSISAKLHLKPKPRSNDLTSIYMRKSRYAQLQGYYSQKIAFEIERASQKGWFMVFDTLTLSDDGLKRFYRDQSSSDKKPIRGYCNTIAKSIKAYCDKLGINYEQQYDYYRFVCVPEFGGETNRLHFHLVHFMRFMPPLIGNHKNYRTDRDPNLDNLEMCNRTEITAFHRIWTYGSLNKAIAVRHQADAFTSKLNWRTVKKLNSITGTYDPVEIKGAGALASYLSKYVSKSIEQLEHSSDRWHLELKSKGIDTRVNFRISYSRGFGFADIASMKQETFDTLKELTKLDYESTPFFSLVSHAAKRELKSCFEDMTIEEIERIKPEPYNYTANLRYNLNESDMDYQTLPKQYEKLSKNNISPDTYDYLTRNKYATWTRPNRPSKVLASK